MTAELRIEREPEGFGRIVLARPDAKNALTIAMRDGIIDALREFRGDPGVRALLITGDGDAFCAGMDLGASTVAQAGKPGFQSRSTSEALRAGVQTFIRELWEFDKPTVAAVNGAAVGPGAHLALACDFVLVQPKTRFMWSFAKWGLVADAGGAYLLPRLVGLPKAKAMVMLGEGAVGQEAVDLGLAYKCVDAADLLGTAEALTAQLAAGPTRSLGLSKIC
jgi:2-(1,2-epoxy-1,2-dihydrophenyl)acetyl-CoA isomerase